jgi:sigma-B regulation protein RsbU (phosphoserine phosphatase)
MAAALSPSTDRRLIIRTPDGNSRTATLDRERITLGRAPSNALCYADDAGLSRQHLAFELNGNEWVVRDLGSKNGTYVNATRISDAVPLKPGDRISAGHLSIEYSAPPESGPALRGVEFIDADVAPSASTTMEKSLEGLIGRQQDDSGKMRVFTGNLQTRALIRAGQELAGHLTLCQLFEVILDLSLEAVGAARGVLMVLEGDQLVVKAARGQGFRISSTVRDRVLREGRSELVVDTRMDQAFRERASIVAQNIRSVIAVPLQAGERVIGLIYLDSPDMVRQFTLEDLSLLTVMANVAAIRIEHARLAEVEQQERLLARELDQAALIQKGLLPAKAPVVHGIELAGTSCACRTVGGDYYDFLPYPDGRVAMLVADVAGKGMPAALMMSNLQARVQVLFESPDGLAGKMARLNKAVAANCPDNRFITFFICVIDPASGEVAYCNAGHNPPIIVRKQGEVDKLTTGGVMLGLFPRLTYQEARERLDPGDVLVLYSDGVTEAVRADGGEEFGEDRLAAIVRDHSGEPAECIAAAVIEAVGAFAEGAPQADDITVVAARRPA